MSKLLLTQFAGAVIACTAGEPQKAEDPEAASSDVDELSTTATPADPRPSAALADTNCGSWPGNGIADHDIESQTVVQGGREVKFALVNQRLSDHSFAAFRRGYVIGDQAWVDRSHDGGVTWTQCGPFNSKFSNDLDNFHNWMRACVRFNGASFCTPWHYDT